MRIRLAAAAFALAAVATTSAAEAAYRLCIRAGGFEGRNYATVMLSLGGVVYVANNGGYFNPGYAPLDTCFGDAVAFGSAKIGWSYPRYDCVGAAIPEGHTAEVWFIVDAVKADPGLGGLMPTCRRAQ
ncbi:MAG: hypothetical protein IT561_04070 [Alphaproteobacteria bacterium]|nr:hypothetical protein [Alphaproteobacteria bacterium]